MHTAKEKLSNMGSSIKGHAKLSSATIHEKTQMATARTKDEKVMIHEQKKAKDAEVKMELHQAKADHKADKLNARHARVMHGHGHAAAPHKDKPTHS